MDYCNAQYYNFKKGTEKCEYRETCDHYKHYIFLERTNEPTYEKPSVQFKNIKEFRNCKKHETLK